MTQKLTTPRPQRRVLALRPTPVPVPRRRKPCNDNDKTDMSGLSFREQQKLEQRAADLAWQIRFSKMKLHHWPNLDNWGWTSLDALKRDAEDLQAELPVQ